MKEKKTVGFDILDNAGLNEIDKIGTDMDMLDEKTKKRILEMTKKRFNDAIKGENTGIEKIVTDENAEVVENVEVYNRSKIRKIMTGVVNTAAVVGLAAGSVFLVKNIGRGDIDKPVEPDLPAVSTTEPANQTQEEIARNKRLEYEVQATFECYEKNIVGLSVDDLKIDYAYLDINNDSVDELFIRSKVLDIPESVSTTIYFFNGTEYIAFYRIVADEFKFDLQNRKYYEILKENDDDTDYCLLRILTWENVEFSDGDQDYLTYFTPQDNYEGGQFYLHDNNRCTKEEFENAIAEYENCVGAELNFIPYTVKRETAEKTARNQRIEDLIKYIYVSHNTTLDKDSFNDTLKIEYAYLDINNDSVDELLIRYNFHDFYYSGIELNCFDGTEYKAFENIAYGSKFDLQNRKLYELHDSYEYKGFENEFFMEVKTWENAEISCDVDFFTYQENYHYYMYEGELFYIHNGEQCTEEELNAVREEYEKCDSAELNFIPYNVKKLNGQSAEESARNQEIEVSYEPEGQVIEQSIEAGEKPDGEVPITFDLPAEANGRFVIAFMVQKEDGTPEIQESGTFYCPEYCQLTQNIIGSGKNVNVTAIITNLSNNKRATIGTYSFNFAEGRYTCLSGGDPYTAFEAIGAFPEPETESPPLPKYGDEEPPVEDSTTTTE